MGAAQGPYRRGRPGRQGKAENIATMSSIPCALSDRQKNTDKNQYRGEGKNEIDRSGPTSKKRLANETITQTDLSDEKPKAPYSIGKQGEPTSLPFALTGRTPARGRGVAETLCAIRSDLGEGSSLFTAAQAERGKSKAFLILSLQGKT